MKTIGKWLLTILFAPAIIVFGSFILFTIVFYIIIVPVHIILFLAFGIDFLSLIGADKWARPFLGG